VEILVVLGRYRKRMPNVGGLRWRREKRFFPDTALNWAVDRLASAATPETRRNYTFQNDAPTSL
jgi:hypothetical protein